MIHSVRFTCVLDTNIIYPIVVRDILFWFAHYDLFTPKWSQHIFDEWHKLMQSKGINESEARRRSSVATKAFPDALVTHYEGLINSLELPDPKDRHVLAAAIKTNANLIVTNNLKDFPRPYLEKFGLSAKSADDFLTDIIDLNTHLATKAFREMVMHRSNPPMDIYQVLDSLRKNGLLQTANYLHAQI